MKDIEKILNLDCRKKSSMQIIQKELRGIKSLSKLPTNKIIPLSKIENVMWNICSDWCISLQGIYMHVDIVKKDMFLNCWIKTDDDHKALVLITAINTYELYAKIVIFLICCVRGEYKNEDRGFAGKLKRREEHEREKRQTQ